MEKLENKERELSSLKQPIGAINSVSLRGKINRVSRLRYSPAGDAILEIGLSVRQELLKKESVGSFDAFCVGDIAETFADKLKIGQEITLIGSLWVRRFKSKEGGSRIETVISVKKLEE